MLHLPPTLMLRKEVEKISKLVLGFDIDGVLTNDDDGSNNLWLQKAAEYFEQEMIRPSFYIEEAFDRSVEEVQKFFQIQAESIMSSVPIRKNCSAVLAEFWSKGHTIHLITARDEEHRQLTKDWLAKHGLNYHELHMSPRGQSYSKGDRCRELGVHFFVDDKFENALDVAQHGIYTLLFNASHNHGKQTNLPRITSWSEIYDHVEFLLQDTLSASSR